ncbi:MAG: PEP-CTERM sorting domain-containing protein [Verrucomicrobiota bacterium]
MKLPSFVVTSIALLLPATLQAATVYFFADFEYGGADPAVATDAADLNTGMTNLVGSFSGTLPTSANNAFNSPSIVSFQNDTATDNHLRIDRPSGVGQFSADLTSTVSVDGLFVSFDLLSRRGSNTGAGSFNIIGLDDSGNEAFNLFVDADKNSDPGNQLAVVSGAGTVDYDPVTTFGGTGTPLSKDLNQSGGLADIASISMVLGATDYSITLDTPFNSGNQWTANSVAYNGSATTLSRIVFTVESDTGFYLDDLWVADEAIPEPSAVSLLGLSAALVALRRRRA